jgi:endonuclease IV
MRRILTHPRLRELPFIMETPKKRPNDDIMNIRAAKRLAGLK